MREGTTSRLMAVDRPYGEFYDFYSVSPEYFRHTLVSLMNCRYLACQSPWYISTDYTLWIRLRVSGSLASEYATLIT
jgi:hypothetical protein